MEHARAVPHEAMPHLFVTHINLSKCNLATVPLIPLSLPFPEYALLGRRFGSYPPGTPLRRTALLAGLLDALLAGVEGPFAFCFCGHFGARFGVGLLLCLEGLILVVLLLVLLLGLFVVDGVRAGPLS